MRARSASLERTLTEAENELETLIVPQDADDQKSIIVEVRAGAGGLESSLFAAEMVAMYEKYAARRRWQFEVRGSVGRDARARSRAHPVVTRAPCRR